MVAVFLAFAALFLLGGVSAYFGADALATWLLTAGALGAVGTACYSMGGHNAERRRERH